MIYVVQFRNKKPQRIDERHAYDFYQVWFGNERGQMYYDEGERKVCPQYPQLSLWGEDITEAGWFKKILVGEADDGMFDIHDAFKLR